MVIPIRNHVLETIKQKENFTDKELQKLLVKDGTTITESEFNKDTTTGISAPPIGRTNSIPSKEETAISAKITFLSVGFSIP